MTATTIFDALSPADLGLPPKFASFRLAQRQALEWLDSCEHHIRAACLPTGAGKTAIAVAYARILGVKAVYLVATKQLQQQVLSDFESMGMVDVRGRANYSCENYRNCDEGYDENCSLHGTTGCPYACAVERAANSELVITNYAYWLHSGGTKNKAFGGTGLLVCDEAHALEGQLSGYASIKIYASEGLHRRLVAGSIGNGVMDNALAPEAGHSSGFIFEWAHKQIVKLKDTADEDEQDLLDRCKRILKMNPNWVWQFDDRGHCTFEPVRLSQFSRSLFGSIPRVLLMSATLNEFTLKLLLPSDLEYDYRSWNAVFPPQNAPVYHIPCRKMSWKSSDEDYQALVQTADDIIDRRSDRKGIIHTVSYARAKRALQYSRHRRRFIWNEDGSELARCLERFRAAPAESGAILVTPSVAAGFDFPGEACEYQIILKFPFPNETQRVIKERCTQINGYRLWSAAQEIVQMAGRARRYESDRCESFVLDNSVRQLTGAEGRAYCPPGFRIFTVAQVPPAPPKITATEQPDSDSKGD